MFNRCLKAAAVHVIGQGDTKPLVEQVWIVGLGIDVGYSKITKSTFPFSLDFYLEAFGLIGHSTVLEQAESMPETAMKIPGLEKPSNKVQSLYCLLPGLISTFTRRMTTGATICFEIGAHDQ